MEKCGIIKNGCPVVVYPIQEKEALETIGRFSEDYTISNRDSVKILSSDINGNRFLYNGTEYQTRLHGQHQIYNAVTAIETAKRVGMADDKDIVNGVYDAIVAARVEIISEKPLVVLDGSHNPNGADALASFMKNCDQSIIAIIGMMADKDCELFLKKILPFCSSAITVTVKENKRAISAEELKKLAEKYCSDVTAAESYEEAIATATKKADKLKPIFVCGSLYLAGAIRETLKNTF